MNPRGEIPYGYCQCGCGGVAPIAKQTISKQGYRKGEPVKFIQGHNCCGKGKCNPRWNEGRTINGSGYAMVFTPDHQRADKYGYVYEQILVLEKAMGRPILRTEAIHHLDGNKLNNAPGNLVLFATLSMHTKFHMWLRKQRWRDKGEEKRKTES
jgi:hypothetical protein